MTAAPCLCVHVGVGLLTFSANRVSYASQAISDLQVRLCVILGDPCRLSTIAIESMSYRGCDAVLQVVCACKAIMQAAL